jgi:hypothetical protein
LPLFDELPARASPPRSADISSSRAGRFSSFRPAFFFPRGARALLLRGVGTRSYFCCWSPGGRGCGGTGCGGRGCGGMGWGGVGAGGCGAGEGEGSGLDCGAGSGSFSSMTVSPPQPTRRAAERESAHTARIIFFFVPASAGRFIKRPPFVWGGLLGATPSLTKTLRL